jgi:hypothetical protein
MGFNPPEQSTIHTHPRMTAANSSSYPHSVWLILACSSPRGLVKGNQWRLSRIKAVVCYCYNLVAQTDCIYSGALKTPKWIKPWNKGFPNFGHNTARGPSSTAHMNVPLSMPTPCTLLIPLAPVISQLELSDREAFFLNDIRQ